MDSKSTRYVTPSTRILCSATISSMSWCLPMVAIYLTMRLGIGFISTLHPFPTADPFPVAGIPFVALNNVGGALCLLMGNQGGKDGGDLWQGVFALLRGLHLGTLLEKAGIITA